MLRGASLNVAQVCRSRSRNDHWRHATVRRELNWLQCVYVLTLRRWDVSQRPIHTVTINHMITQEYRLDVTYSEMSVLVPPPSTSDIKASLNVWIQSMLRSIVTLQLNVKPFQKYTRYKKNCVFATAKRLINYLLESGSSLDGWHFSVQLLASQVRRLALRLLARVDRILCLFHGFCVFAAIRHAIVSDA